MTNERWAEWRADVAEAWAEGREQGDDGPYITHCPACGDFGFDPTPHNLDTMAMLNDLEPDGSPDKITPEMVFALHEVIANFEAAYMTAGGENPRIVAQYGPPVRALEAILTQLLPPDQKPKE